MIERFGRKVTRNQLEVDRPVFPAHEQFTERDVPNLPSVSTLRADDADFPRAIKSMPDGPSVLWIAGKLLAVDRRAVAVVGSRDASPAAVDHAFAIGQALAEAGYTVVSGLARGIDGAAHRGALSEPGGRTIAVVGTGLEETYPREHAQLDAEIRRRGAVISQLPPGTGVHGRNFSARNALIAALSIASVIVVAGERSGTRIEMEQAVKQGKRVFLWQPCMSEANWPSGIVQRGDADFVASTEDLLSRLCEIA